VSEEPKLFPVKLVWTGGKSGNLTVEGKVAIKTGIPSGGPEEARAMCFMNGFVEFTKKMHIEFKSFECDAVGTLEKVDRSFEVTKIDMKTRVAINTEDIRKKITRALELAAKYCFIGNSMKCPISHDSKIIVE
jgi:organic hydroperoxide reductase OsmC/OhrA